MFLHSHCSISIIFIFISTIFFNITSFFLNFTVVHVFSFHSLFQLSTLLFPLQTLTHTRPYDLLSHIFFFFYLVPLNTILFLLFRNLCSLSFLVPQFSSLSKAPKSLHTRPSLRIFSFPPHFIFLLVFLYFYIFFKALLFTFTIFSSLKVLIKPDGLIFTFHTRFFIFSLFFFILLFFFHSVIFIFILFSSLKLLIKLHISYCL